MVSSLRSLGIRGAIIPGSSTPGSLNSMSRILAHVSLVGQVCERFVDHLLSLLGSMLCSAPTVPSSWGSAVSGFVSCCWWAQHPVVVSCRASLLSASPNGPQPQLSAVASSLSCWCSTLPLRARSSVVNLLSSCFGNFADGLSVW